MRKRKKISLLDLESMKSIEVNGSTVIFLKLEIYDPKWIQKIRITRCNLLITTIPNTHCFEFIQISFDNMLSIFIHFSWLKIDLNLCFNFELNKNIIRKCFEVTLMFFKYFGFFSSLTYCIVINLFPVCP